MVVYDVLRGDEVEGTVDLTRTVVPQRPVAEPPAVVAGSGRFRGAEPVVRQPLGRGRVVVVANVKGGSYRTTTALVLGSVFGHVRGGGVAVWDCQENYATLGRRAEVPDPDRTVRQLLAERDRRPGGVQVGPDGPVGYLRHQTSGCDLLAGDGVPLAPRDHAWVGSRLRPHFDLVVVDTGTDHRRAGWRWAVSAADQLVIPLPLRPDSAAAAAWMCQYLTANGFSSLVRGAVVVAVRPQRFADSAMAARIDEYFAERTAQVVHVPMDRRLAAGNQVGWSTLTPRSRRAWTTVAATVAGRLAGNRSPEAPRRKGE